MPFSNDLILKTQPPRQCNSRFTEIEKPVVINSCFSLRVNTDDMMYSGLCNGDIIVVNIYAEVKDGSLVIALMNNMLYMRRLKIKFNKALLVSDNPSVAAIELSTQSGCRICGVIVSSTTSQENPV